MADKILGADGYLERLSGLRLIDRGDGSYSFAIEDSKGVPAEHVFLIVPDDDENLAHMTRGLSFGVAGDLKITTVGGETVVIPSGSLAAGIVHPVCATKVFATGTTADDLVGYY